MSLAGRKLRKPAYTHIHIHIIDVRLALISFGPSHWESSRRQELANITELICHTAKLFLILKPLKNESPVVIAIILMQTAVPTVLSFLDYSL